MGGPAAWAAGRGQGFPALGTPEPNSPQRTVWPTSGLGEFGRGRRRAAKVWRVHWCLECGQTQGDAHQDAHQRGPSADAEPRAHSSVSTRVLVCARPCAPVCAHDAVLPTQSWPGPTMPSGWVSPLGCHPFSRAMGLSTSLRPSSLAGASTLPPWEAVWVRGLRTGRQRGPREPSQFPASGEQACSGSLLTGQLPDLTESVRPHGWEEAEAPRNRTEMELPLGGRPGHSPVARCPRAGAGRGRAPG